MKAFIVLGNDILDDEDDKDVDVQGNTDVKHVGLISYKINDLILLIND